MSAHRFGSRRARRPLSCRQRPAVEQLEDRCLLTAPVFTVTNTGDNNGVNPNPGAGTGTLRQAIVDADHAGGQSTIRFASGVTGTITLAGVLPDLTAAIDLEGPGANVVTVKGPGTANFGSIFTVDAGAVVTVAGLTITGGNTSYGGGVLNFGNLSLNYDTISGNTATVLGGGIANDTFPPSGKNPFLVVLDCTVSGNTVNTGTAGAGGIDVEGGTATLINCTISGNQAVVGSSPFASSNGAGGVGVYGGTANLDHCTIADNTPTGGTGNAGGVDAYGSGVFLFDTIVARNSDGSSYNDVAGKVTSGGHNLIGVNDVSKTPAPRPASGFVSSDLVGAGASPEDPKLSAALGNNGGPTQTYSFTSSSSPAIDAGDNTQPPPSDQRGRFRIVNGTIDIGAVEFNSTVVVSKTTLTLSPASPAPGQPFTVTATVGPLVTGATTAVPDGTLRFTVDGADPNQTDPPLDGNGQATLSLPSGLPAGQHTIGGIGGGDGFTSSTASLTLNLGGPPTPPSPPPPPPPSPPGVNETVVFGEVALSFALQQLAAPHHAHGSHPPRPDAGLLARLASDLATSPALDTPAGRQALQDLNEFFQDVGAILAGASSSQAAHIVSELFDLGLFYSLYSDPASPQYHSPALAQSIFNLEKLLLTPPSAGSSAAGTPKDKKDFLVFHGVPIDVPPDGTNFVEEWFVENFTSFPIALTVIFSTVVTPPEGSPITLYDEESYVVPARASAFATGDLLINASFPNYQVVSASFV
jgi:hypothetical protein